jgi:hypothetical protein
MRRRFQSQHNGVFFDAGGPGNIYGPPGIYPGRSTLRPYQTLQVDIVL